MTEPQGEVCIANIGRKGIAMRRRLGISGFGLGTAIAALLIVSGVSPIARLPVALLFLFGAYGWFQAREKT